MARATKSPTSKRSSRTRKSSAKSSTPDIPNYHGALKFLHDHLDVERVRSSRVDESAFSLDRMRALMKALDDPQEELRCVHVGGTNGKGSVIAMLESCLRECGYTVGVYTSPHLTDIRERIHIGDTIISHHAFTQLMKRVAEASVSIPKKHGQCTYFEIVTALGMLHFAEQAVDLALIEVGMGGRLDSTNIMTPEVSVVTRIDLDHTH
ncbi:MAG: hypothetical protein AAFX05_05055, partial [Planctomycetota bacterium]